MKIVMYFYSYIGYCKQTQGVVHTDGRRHYGPEGGAGEGEAACVGGGWSSLMELSNCLYTTKVISVKFCLLWAEWPT